MIALPMPWSPRDRFSIGGQLPPQQVSQRSGGERRPG
jgi:hypothetical protein